jgi:citrate lyase synthetase
MKFDELYKRLINEAFDPDDYNLNKGYKKVTLIIGRFQPFTLGHSSLLKQAKNPVVIGIVKGKKSGQDKDKNPLEFDLQKEIIEKAKIPKIERVIKVESAFIPEIISQLRFFDLEVDEVFAGSDRIKSYTSMMKKYGPQINAPDVKVTEIKRDPDASDVSGISATKVRNSIKSDDFESAKEMMINLDKKLFDKIQKELK